MKYKYSRKVMKIIFANLPFWSDCKYSSEDGLNFIDMLLAKQPKQKLIGEKTSSKILDSGTHQPISKPKSKVNPKTCNHQWKQQGEGPNCYCEKCHSLLVKKGNRPTLQPIEKIPIRIKEQTETTILVNQWDLAHKVNQIIDRINLLSIKNKI
jgi:hypothetical protein